MSTPLPRGLYAITPAHDGDAGSLATLVEAALCGGARVVQYRDKTGSGPRRLAAAGALASLCDAHDARLIVNDDVDLALAAGAAGVHVGLEDASVRAARSALGRAGIVGATCHGSLDLALQAERDGADYVAFGSFFASPTKPGARRAPIGLLAEARARLRLPIVAIGGITLDNGARLVAAGAHCLAVVSAVFGAPDVRAAARGFTNLVDAARPAQLETEHR